MSFTHPKDIAQALFRAASLNEKDGTFLVKSFDASLDDVARALVSGCGKSATVKQQGLFSKKSSFSQHAVEVVKAAPTLSQQESWKRLNYAPHYDLGKTVADVAGWYLRNPWATEEQA